MGALTFCFSFLITFYLKLIVACRLGVIYVKENDDYTACMYYMDPNVDVHCPQRLLYLFVHSLTLRPHEPLIHFSLSVILCRWRVL